ncbi:Uncharacterised protein [Streptococcus pneumoniae]|nr:Uncharacterised protein [Streptococcus pneumoniae]
MIKNILNCKKLVRTKLIRNIGEYYVKKKKILNVLLGKKKLELNFTNRGNIGLKQVLENFNY